jgi:hypothetical protein
LRFGAVTGVTTASSATNPGFERTSANAHNEAQSWLSVKFPNAGYNTKQANSFFIRVFRVVRG